MPPEDVREGLKSARQQICLPPVGLGSCPLSPWICWSLWKARNQKLFNNRSFSVEETLLKAIKDAKEWQDAQVSKDSGLIARLRPPPITSSTNHDHLMTCNSDAAWRHDVKIAGLGWIFLDPSSGISSHHSAVSEGVSSPLMAESLACRAALLEAMKKNVLHLHYASDCQQLVSVLKSRSSLLEIHGILADIFICIRSFVTFVCRHTPRSENEVADGLAKQALALYEPIF